MTFNEAAEYLDRIVRAKNTLANLDNEVFAEIVKTVTDGAERPIRCKNCTYFAWYEDIEQGYCRRDFNNNSVHVQEDDFCSRAKLYVPDSAY